MKPEIKILLASCATIFAGAILLDLGATPVTGVSLISLGILGLLVGPLAWNAP